VGPRRILFPFVPWCLCGSISRTFQRRATKTAEKTNHELTSRFRSALSICVNLRHLRMPHPDPDRFDDPKIHLVMIYTIYKVIQYPYQNMASGIATRAQAAFFSPSCLRGSISRSFQRTAAKNAENRRDEPRTLSPFPCSLPHLRQSASSADFSFTSLSRTEK